MEVWRVSFTSSCFLHHRLHLGPEIWPNNREMYPRLCLWTRMSGQAGIEWARYHRTQRCGFLSSVQGSCGLLSKCETCFDSFWSWKQTRGLPLCLRRGSAADLECENENLNGSVLVNVFFQSGLQAIVQTVKKLSVSSIFLLLLFSSVSLSAHPSSLCLWADTGVVIYQTEFWKTVGCAQQDVGYVEESGDGLRVRASRRERLKNKDEQDNKTILCSYANIYRYATSVKVIRIQYLHIYSVSAFS